MPNTTNVVKIGEKKCKPFIIDVMVFSPEAGYKIEFSVERGCTATNDSIWKVVFDLYKKKAKEDGFDQLVHVSYQGKDPEENKKIQQTIHGVNAAQADILLNKGFEAQKAFADNPNETIKAEVINTSQAFVLSAAG